MKIGVCVKQVPDTEARLRVNADGTWIDEQDLPFTLNESDQCALEAALQLAESRGGEVVVVSLGPERAAEALRKTLALGAGRAVHLADEPLLGGDAWSTARALAAALEREALDLVLTGSQSDDVGYGATASFVAAFLGWPHAWLVMGVDLAEDAGSATVVREMESGSNEVFRLALPAVLEVQAGINHPRYASLRGIMQAKRKPIERLTCAELGLDPGEVGWAGARLEVVSVSFPEREGEVELIAGEPAEAAAELVDKLRREARVL